MTFSMAFDLSYHRVRSREPYPTELGIHHIRLVALLPGHWADDICCELFSLLWNQEGHPVPEYTALSYAWGLPGREPSRILVNDCQFEVWANLECALRHLRLRDRLLILWVDALCINQSNNAERNKQVSLMCDIYGRAAQVVVFLGPGPQVEGSPKNKDLEDNVVFKNDPTDDISFLGLAIHLTRLNSLGGIADSKLTAIFEALRRMLTVRWWDRIWVVQEVVTGHTVTVRYGNASAPWAMLVDIATAYSQEAFLKYTTVVSDDNMKVLKLFSRVIDIDRLRQAWVEGQRPTLLSLLRDFSYRRASDDRDRIYGLLGLCDSKTRVSPNYYLSAKEAYISAAISFIRTDQSLSILSGDLGRKNRNDLPSWVPDWSTTFEEYERQRADFFDFYTACGEAISIIGRDTGFGDDPLKSPRYGLHIYNEMSRLAQSLDAVMETKNLLPQCISVGLDEYGKAFGGTFSDLCNKLKGFCHPEGRRYIKSLVDFNFITVEGEHDRLAMHSKCIGIVEQVFEPLFSSTDMDAVSESIKTWFAGAVLTRSLQDDRGLIVAFIVTLMSDIKKTRNGFERLSVKDEPSLINWFTQRILKRSAPPIDSESAEREAEMLDSFTEVMRISTTKRVFFITKCGEMGLGPASMTKQDEIYVLPGGKVPFVLRHAYPPSQCRGL
ncbi:hypothetical protein NUW58_g3549 [Xylaria curta]|uniref:Uncharacterized protein n=1 Tax=Xylaria curta TaxID=42375 RepID=A0ACC1PD72_9PEZI|nr:hypothetical protein NUW58_g3549 [Xylaria curta]